MGWIVLLVFCALGIMGDALVSADMTTVRTDPGQNVSVMWNVDMHRSPFIRPYTHIDVTVERQGTTNIVLLCPSEYCNRHRRGYENIQLITEPQVDRDTHFDRIERIGFSISNVSLENAGLYWLRLDGYSLRPDVLLYVNQSPTKPVINSTISGDDVIISCSSESQSVPEEFRKQSVLEYTWRVDRALTGYVIQGDIIRITNWSKTNNSRELSCTATEADSMLASQSSDIYILNVPYLENVTITGRWINADSMDYGLLSCTADCNPQCTYQWLDSAGRVVSTGPYMEVTPDMGKMSCEAMSLGNSMKSPSIRLSDHGAPRDPTKTVISLSVLLAVVTTGAVCMVVVLVVQKRRLLKRPQPSPDIPPTLIPTAECLYENDGFQSLPLTKQLGRNVAKESRGGHGKATVTATTTDVDNVMSSVTPSPPTTYEAMTPHTPLPPSVYDDIRHPQHTGGYPDRNAVPSEDDDNYECI